MKKDPINTGVIKDIKRESDRKKSDYQRTIELLMNDDYQRRKTNVSPQQVSIINTLDVIAQLYEIDFLKLWVDGFGQWRTSVSGKGREDIVKIGMAQYEQMEKHNQELMNMLGLSR